MIYRILAILVIILATTLYIARLELRLNHAEAQANQAVSAAQDLQSTLKARSNENAAIVKELKAAVARATSSTAAKETTNNARKTDRDAPVAPLVLDALERLYGPRPDQPGQSGAPNPR